MTPNPTATGWPCARWWRSYAQGAGNKKPGIAPGLVELVVPGSEKAPPGTPI